jgi:hypothetical protein
VDFIRALPNVRFVTSSDLPLLYPDRVRSAGVTEKNLAELAARLGSDRNGGLDFQTIGNQAYSLADQFELLLLAVGQWVQDRQPRFPLVAHGLLGPDHPPPASPPLSLDGAAFRAAVLDALAFVQTERRVPARVFVGAEAVAPGDFLAGLATACDFHSRYGKLPLAESVRFPANREILPARRVAKDTPGLFGGWVIHKEGFRAPRILEQARLQAWTLKPALRQD